MKTFAYLGSASAGGTTRVFETLRDGLARRGWQGRIVNDENLSAELIARGEAAVLQALCDQLAAFDLVIGNVFMPPRLMNVIRFLPADTPRIMIVHNITRATYLAARSLKDHVNHTVAVSSRIREDLIRDHGFAAENITTIYNAVGDALFNPPITPVNGEKVGILSLGRIEQHSKRVFLIPEILKGIDSRLYRLTIAGYGPDRDELLSRLSHNGIPFDALGRVSRDELAGIYKNHEVFLFPSRFEGLGIAAAEAMASGLVPISAAIRGVTSQFIEDSKSGFIFKQGDVSAARQYLGQIIKDPKLRFEMRHAAHVRAAQFFSESKMIEGYENVLNSALVSPEIHPLNLRSWRPPLAMGPGLRGLLPTKLRRRLADLLIYR